MEPRALSGTDIGTTISTGQNKVNSRSENSNKFNNSIYNKNKNLCTRLCARSHIHSDLFSVYSDGIFCIFSPVVLK